MRRYLVCIMALASLVVFASAPAEARSHRANPCAAKNPCAVNPCAAKAANPCAVNPCAANPCAANPCAAKNPCGVNPCAVNPCAANPCAAKNPCAANPCASKNPCGANPCNPCAGRGGARGPVSVKTVWAHVVSASPRSLVIKANGGSLKLQLTKRTEIKMAAPGMQKKTVADLRPGTRVAVSFVDRNGTRQAAYIYLARAAANPCAANPCAANPCGANPCAMKNPCAANPCAARNPCAANPCAARNPCAANPCNPCAARNPCNPCGARR